MHVHTGTTGPLQSYKGDVAVKIHLLPSVILKKKKLFSTELSPCQLITPVQRHVEIIVFG